MSATPRRKPMWARRPNAKPRHRDREPLRRLKEALRGLPVDELLEAANDEACCILVRPAEGTAVPAADHAWAREWLSKPRAARQRECVA